MSKTTDDRWAAGKAYDAYMGRWSKLVAAEFLHWLAPAPGGHFLEIGCGTGALTESIVRLSEPGSIVACDQSAPFVEHARSMLPDARVSFVAAAASSLPDRSGGFDIVVSGLVLNFVPEPEAALRAMRERIREGGTVAAYVWDYSGGIEFLRYFWEEAVASDPNAAALDEARRFGDWETAHLTSLFEAAGLVRVESAPLDVATTFENFDDFWKPFLAGTGPAPAYVVSLSEPNREALAKRLRARLPADGDGRIRLRARAWAVRGIRNQ
jgi:SAM-dependent methyltransferase